MMAANPDDAAVDKIIRRLQDVIDDLKVAQSKDDTDESREEQGSDLKDAAVKARGVFAARRKTAAAKTA